MKNIRSLFLVTISLLLFASMTFAQAEKAVKSDALLFKVTGKGLRKPSYLYGTIHIICPNDMFGMDKLETYFKETEHLTLELDMDDKEVMAKAATALNMPQGKTLRDLLTPEKYAKVDELFKTMLGIPVEALKQFGPFGLSTIVGISPKSTGCAAPASYELKFVELAGKYKFPVDGLENVDDQLNAINKTPLEKQAEDLYKLSLDPEKTVNGFKTLVATYKLQDADKINEYMSKEMKDNPDFQVNMLATRNKNWIPKIEKTVKEKPTFFAVGAAHLGGKDGVINLLRQKGYKVTPIKL